MDRNRRLLVGVLAVVAVVVLFVVLRPKGSEGPAGGGATAKVAVDVKQGKVAGPEKVSVATGDTVDLTVTTDVEDEVHVHGYDLMKDVSPASPAHLSFTADAPGVFEVELEGPGLLLFELEVTG